MAGHARRHGLAGLTPEGIDVGIGGTDGNGGRRSAGEVQRDAARRDGLDRAEGRLVVEELAIEVERDVFGEDPPHQRHGLAGTAIAGVVGDEVTFAPLVRFIPAGDEMDGDPSATAQVIERGRHAGQQDGLHESGPVRHQYAQSAGARQTEAATIQASGATAP